MMKLQMMAPKRQQPNGKDSNNSVSKSNSNSNVNNNNDNQSKREIERWMVLKDDFLTYSNYRLLPGIATTTTTSSGEEEGGRKTARPDVVRSFRDFYPYRYA